MSRRTLGKDWATVFVALGAAMGLMASCLAARAHDGVVHASPEEAARHAAETAGTGTGTGGTGEAAPAALPPLGAATPFPIEIEARFALVDQHGQPRSEADYAGRHLLLFFGYAGCEAICDVALPRMAAVLDLLDAGPDRLAAAMITIDPENDTPEALAEAMPAVHPRLDGLTGSAEALAAARAAFQVEATKVTELPDGTPVYAHGSFVYLLDREGRVATILPPVLSEARMAEIVARYLDTAS
ncbi:MAG: SCO family protein [Pseudomonadota bacterium]